MIRGKVCLSALAAWLAVAGLLVNSAEACRRCRSRCESDCRTITGYKTVEKTIQVPEWVLVKRKVQCTEHKRKIVTRHRMVHKFKPVVKEVTRHYTKIERVKKSRVEEYTGHEPVWKDHKVTNTVYDRVHVKKKGVRKVCRVHVSKEKRTVCRDMGCWEDREVCCRLGCCTKICRVWVPKIVKQDIMVDVCKNVWVDEPFEYTEVQCKPRQVTRTVRRLHYNPVKKKRTVYWVECHPKTIAKKVKVIHYERITVKEPYQCETWEPVVVTREITERVCKMVAKKVKVKMPVYATVAPVTADCGTSSSCCSKCGRHRLLGRRCCD